MVTENSDAFDIIAEFDALIKSMRGGYSFLKEDLDDTTLILLATSLIDEFLKFILLLRFGSSVASKRAISHIFSGTGTLATFSAKIDLCSALGVIGEDEKHDLAILKKIRNDFAHSPNRLYLKDMQRCVSLRLAPDGGGPTGDVIKERRKVKESCSAIVSRLSVSAIVGMAEGEVLRQHKATVLKTAEAMLSDVYKGGGLTRLS